MSEAKAKPTRDTVRVNQRKHSAYSSRRGARESKSPKRSVTRSEYLHLPLW